MAPIDHVFVLMLENRSFDHMLGFSGIRGTDAATGQLTSINGLTGSESNVYSGDGKTYTVSYPADWTMALDPPHEFPDTVTQLCGPTAGYPPGGPYPAIDNSGFVDAWMRANPAADPGDIMKCYAPDQLPVLNALATEFAVCDNWCASIPGPTWPNRLYAMAASSGGLDCSPSPERIQYWLVRGFEFQNGTLFADVGDATTGWRIYRGDQGPLLGKIPIAGALTGIHPDDISQFSSFAQDVAAGADYPYRYTWIEPNYGDLVDNTYSGGTSQHPMDTVVGGEQLIKQVYEALRANEALWESSMLIVTWDEHGGFYDHVAPGPAPAPGDTVEMDFVNEYGFDFRQYGVRVPAVVASPYVAQNVIDHRLYDHASIPATVERQFRLPGLTARDRAANDVLSLLTLASPRATPPTLPDPSGPGVPPVRDPDATAAAAAQPLTAGNLAGVVGVAAKADAQLSPQAEGPAIQARVAAIQTRGQAAEYVGTVAQKLDAAAAAPAPARASS